MRPNGKNTRTWVAGLAALGLCLVGVATSQAQAPAFQTKSPGLKLFLDNLTPAARRHADKALQELAPVQVQAVERFRDAQPRQMVVLAAQGTSRIHASLPARAQQRFMNGIFGVTRADKQFTEVIVQQQLQIALQRVQLSIRFNRDLRVQLERRQQERLRRAEETRRRQRAEDDRRAEQRRADDRRAEDRRLDRARQDRAADDRRAEQRRLDLARQQRLAEDRRRAEAQQQRRAEEARRWNQKRK
jgi:hypothetical protein